MPHIDLTGGRFYYEDTGGDGPVVVLSHGILMDADMWAPQVEVLRSGFRCITWDQRGHSRTGAPGSFSYWTSAQDLFELLDQLQVAKAILVGMSQGGFVSLRAALLEPERVRALVLIDSQAGAESEQAVPLYQSLFDEWERSGMTDEIAATVAYMIIQPADARAWIEKWRTTAPEDFRDAFVALLTRDDIHERLGEITCPSLVIHGNADPAISLELAGALRDGLANCRGLVEVEGAGHASNLSHPDEVNRALQDFLAEL